MTARLSAFEYDQAAMEAGWDSPLRVRAFVESRLRGGMVVVDLGIGTGQAIQGYADKGVRVIGIDHDPAMLDTAGHRIDVNGRTIRADINEQLPLSDVYGAVDVVQAVGVLEFARDFSKLVHQVVTLLKPSGLFIGTIEVTTGDALAVERFDELTVYRHSVDEVRATLEQNGLKVHHEELYDGYRRGDTPSAGVPYYLFVAQPK